MVATARLFQDYLDYLSFQKSYSEHTTAAYLNDLEQFRLFQTEEFDVRIKYKQFYTQEFQVGMSWYW